MRFAALGFLLVLSLGCSATRRTDGQWVAGRTLKASPRVLMLPVAGGDPEGSQKLTSALLATLSGRSFRVVVSTTGPESGASALDHASKDGFDYVLAGNVKRWGDEVELTVTLFDVTSRESVAEASHYAKKRPGHWPSDPEDFIPELADCSLSKIFGWTPKTYTGDPPH